MDEPSWLQLWHQSRLAFVGVVLGCILIYWWHKNGAKKVAADFEAEEKPVIATIAKRRNEPKRIQGQKSSSAGQRAEDSPFDIQVQPLVFFASLTGTTETYAKLAAQMLKDGRPANAGGRILDAQIHDMSYVEFDDFFVSTPEAPPASPNVRYFYVILVPTYNIDTILNTFLDHLHETHHDFRVDTGTLSGILGYSVFGLGDKEGWPTEEEGYCSQAKEIDKWMARLSNRKRAYPLGTGNVKGNVKEELNSWVSGVRDVISTFASGGGLGEGIVGSGDAVESDEEDVMDEEESFLNDTQSKPKNRKKASSKSTVIDLEDLGFQTTSKPRVNRGEDGNLLAVDFTTYGAKAAQPKKPEVKAMVPVNSPTYAALTKQGYSIIGTHSGVKICRWTKSALRGRGSCYKRSFYGIASHLCMEATPSLSCSNKCVFCWRHGTNPVGTTWRWEVDPPEMILEGALEAHIKKIKVMRGVPGVRADRFAQAMRVRHCALSLVGEPIFYPRINEFLSLLHAKRISSFLVCNAQHPQQLESLDKVTQLYVSIDASNKESLRRVDRPLHRDFWERFQKCLDILRSRRFQQRTVFRLTLVKGFNLEDEVEGYADLVERGLPGFVEIKGVTYCGTTTSASAGLTMQNVPFWAEVQEFVTALHASLRKRGLDYGMAAEHAHSCCALLASSRFNKGGKWHTLIDYERFFELLESGREFGPEDYIGEVTPEWAGWGKGGFDPLDVRVDRKGKPILPADG